MKKDIIVISPIYKIVGREEIGRDTECVHDLIKYWTKENNIHVFYPYVRGMKKIPSFFNRKQFQYYKNGYDYVCDNIKVTLIERQCIVPNQLDGLKIDSKKFKNIILDRINKENLNPSIVIVHIPSASKFFLNNDIFSCKKIAILHYSDIKYFNKKGDKFIKYLNSNFDAIYCRSKSIYNFFSKLKLTNLKKDIIYSGVPDYKIKPVEKEHKNKVKFLYVGKLIKRKNLDILIKALSQIDNSTWELNVIGAGICKKKYVKIVNKLNLNNVFFLGTFDKKKVFEYMAESDVFCMPSVKETLGLVYIEAMLNGCITIGTKNEGIDGIIINEKNGFLVSPNVNNVLSLIKKIYVMDDKVKETIINNAIKTAKYYNEKDMSLLYKKIVDEVSECEE